MTLVEKLFILLYSPPFFCRVKLSYFGYFILINGNIMATLCETLPGRHKYYSFIVDPSVEDHGG